MHIVTQRKQTVQIEVLTDSRQTVETLVYLVTQNQQTVQCQLLTESGENIEVISGSSDKETTKGTV